MIKTLIVEDSGLMRLRIRDVLSADKGIKVIGTANNGQEGLEAIKFYKPDVVITDMIMPHYDGLYLVKEAMAHHPIPIVVLSSLEKTNQQVFEALELGAFGFLDKPKSTRSLGFNQPLIELIKAAANANTAALKKKAVKRNDLDHIFSNEFIYDLVAIGASTGGPGAIEIFIQGLPKTFPVPIVIAQHMPARFLESFATRLNNCSALKIELAQVGRSLLPNHIYICPGTHNTVITENKLNGKPIFGKVITKYSEFNEPSIDCLFQSIAEVYGSKSVGLLMTGMGKDGALGLKKMKEKGSLTIAQDENSSIVFGMPKAAIDIKAADYVLDIKEIPGFVTSCFS